MQTKPTIAQEIRELKKLADEGIITKEEYEKKKNELLTTGEYIEEDELKMKKTDDVKEKQ
ncbi:MAG: SHOCT domain-containing protein [bacterium]